MSLTLSIALCTYNGERFLQKQLDSLLEQTLLPQEIVIRDDHSSDATVELLQAFAVAAGSRGIVIDLQVNPNNLGYRRNFANAIEACHGDLVFLCDQDDIWLADKLERFTKEFEQRPQLLALHSNAVLIDAEDRELPGSLFTSLKVTRNELDRMHDGRGFSTLAGRSIMTGAAMAFRRTLLPDLLPFPTSGWVHDAWIAVIAAMRGEVDTLEAPAICYRLHESNQLGVGKAATGGRRSWRLHLLESERDLAVHLLAHAQRLGIAESLLIPLHARMRHQQARLSMPVGLLGRLPLIWQELRNDGYRQYSRSVRAPLVDLLGL